MTLSLPPLLFLHANGYPAGVYRRFLEPLAGRRALHAIEALGADAQHGPGRGWRRLHAQVCSVIERLPEGPLDLVGHSMGGWLAAMAAARQRGRPVRVVLIDSPMVLGWRDGQLVGFYIADQLLDESTLHNICVDPRHQGEGIGRLLLAHYLQTSAAAGCRCWWLEVRRSNLCAQHLYLQAGYQQVGVRKGYYRAEQGSEDALVMCRGAVE